MVINKLKPKHINPKWTLPKQLKETLLFSNHVKQLKSKFRHELICKKKELKWHENEKKQ